MKKLFKKLFKKVGKILVQFLEKNDEELRILNCLNQIDYNNSKNFAVISRYYLQLSNGIAVRLGRSGIEEDKIIIKQIAHYSSLYKKYREKWINKN